LAVLTISGIGMAIADSSKPQSNKAVQSAGSGVSQLAPKMALDYVAHSPSPTKPGVHLSVSASVVNKGLAPSGPNFKFQMTCSVVSGGACPIASNPTPIAIPNLPVGGSKVFTFVSASAAQAGTFKLSFKVTDASARTVGTSEIDVKVK
jgi:hypothetical protein